MHRTLRKQCSKWLEQEERIERRALEAKKALRREERRLEREDEGILVDDSEQSVGEDDQGYADSDEDVATIVSWLIFASSLTNQHIRFIQFSTQAVPSKPANVKQLSARKSKVPPSASALRPVMSSASSQVQSRHVYRGRSPVPEHVLEPVMARVSLNLRDDTIPPNYYKPVNRRDVHDDMVEQDDDLDE